MVKVGKKIVKYRVAILIASVLLLIPSALGYLGTRINYDVLTYLPEDIETMQGQDIMVNDFGTGAFSMLIVDGMESKDVAKLKEQIEQVDHVTNVLWYDSIMDISVPESMLPQKYYDVFNSETGTMMAVFFDESTSADCRFAPHATTATEVVAASDSGIKSNNRKSVLSARYCSSCSLHCSNSVISFSNRISTHRYFSSLAHTNPQFWQISSNSSSAMFFCCNKCKNLVF